MARLVSEINQITAAPAKVLGFESHQKPAGSLCHLSVGAYGGFGHNSQANYIYP